VYVDNKLDTERIYKEVTFNTGLSDDLFARPPGKPFTGGEEEDQ
jgi:hypothetical protein